MRLDWDNYTKKFQDFLGRNESDVQHEIEKAAKDVQVDKVQSSRSFVICKLAPFIASDETKRLGVYGEVHFTDQFIRSDADHLPPANLIMICAWLIPETHIKDPAGWIRQFHDSDDNVVTGDGGIAFLRWVAMNVGHRIQAAQNSSYRSRCVISATGWDERRGKAYGSYLTRKGWVKSSDDPDQHCILLNPTAPPSGDPIFIWDALPHPAGGWPEDAAIAAQGSQVPS
jgi:hypothetical protein